MAEQRQRRGLSAQEATPVVGAAAKPTKPKNTPPSRPWWWYLTPAGINNEVKFRVKQQQRINATGGYRYAGGIGVPIAGLNNLYSTPTGGLGPSVSQRDIVRGAAQVVPNVALLAINAGQRLTNGGKPADPRTTPVGRVIAKAERGLTAAVGLPQPEQRKPEDLAWQQLGENFTAGAIGAAVAGPLVGARAFTGGITANLAPWAQQALRWTAGTGIESFVATAFTDNRQGNLANAFGENAPLAVGPKDDQLSAALKSLLPNAFGEIAVAGAALGAGHGLGAIGRRLRAGRQAEEVANARQWTTDNGIQTEADGEFSFPENPAPTTPAPAKGTQHANGDWSAEPAPAAAPAPQTRAEAEAQLLGPEPTATAGPTQEMAPGGAVLNPDAKLPEADPDVSPWYDPALPEVDTAVRAAQRLDDDRLVAAASGDGPVLPALEQQLQDQAQTPPAPGMDPAQIAMPTKNLAEPVVPFRDQWASNAVPHQNLMALASPENGTLLHDRVQRLTGREFGDFTRQDILDGIDSLAADGISLLPNRAADGVQLMDPNTIQVDPPRFQFKGGVDAQGQQKGNSLQGVTQWNPSAEGTIQTWTDAADGKTYVVNGHNRLAKAKELGIPSVRVEELPAQTAEQARALGAISNIASGGGTPFDAAKFIREAGIQDAAQLEAAGIPLSSGLGTQGLALSKLPDNLFQAAINGELTMPRALALGGSGLDPEAMARVYQLAQGRPMTDRAFSELVQMSSTAPKVEADQKVLLGDDWIDTTIIKAELAGKIRAELTSNKNLFKRVGQGRSVKKLAEKGGTAVNADQVMDAASTAQAVLAEFDRDKYMAGTAMTQLLNQGAADIANGAKQAVVVKRILQQLETAAEVAPPTPAPKPAEAPVEAPAEPQPLTPQQRTELQKQVVQKAIQNGEVRPSSTPLPELPEGPRDLSDPVKTLEDEVRLAQEYGMEDTIRAHVEKKAEQERMGWDRMTLDEKKANGLLDGWDKPEAINPEVMPPDRPPTPIADMLEGQMRQMAESDARTYRRMDQHIGEMKQGLNELAPIEIPAAASRKITLKTGEGRISGAAETLAGWTRIPGKDPMGIQQALDLVRAKGAILDPDKIPGLNMNAARNEQAMGMSTPNTEAVANAYRQFYGVDGPAQGGSLASIKGAKALIKSDSLTISMAPVDGQKELKRLIRDQIEDEVNRLTGDGVVVFNDDVPWEIVPREWGGDGIKKGPIFGEYNFIDDMISVNGLMNTPVGELLSTAYHESFHRFQFGLMTKQEMKVMDSAWGRLRTEMLSGLSPKNAALLEAQAVGFQNFAHARLQGLDAADEMARESIREAMRETYTNRGDSPDIVEKAIVKSGELLWTMFDRVWRVVDRANNFIRGRGFQNVEDIYDRLLSGKAARQREFDSAAEYMTTDQRKRHAYIDKWRKEPKKAAEDIGNAIAAIDNRIESLKAQAMSGGC